MECPHCHAELTDKPHTFALGEDPDGTWQIANSRCSVCDRLIVNVCNTDGRTFPGWPQSSVRPRLSEDVPPAYADDYHAASQVLFLSPESAAALSRRLLQRLLVDKSGAADGGLMDQIRRVVLGDAMPGYLKEGLQTYSRLARLDDRPAKSLHPQALAPVEEGEAEWLLDLLQSLCELYFVQPARLQRKLAGLEERLTPPAPKAAPIEPEVAAPEQTAAEDTPAS